MQKVRLSEHLRRYYEEKQLSEKQMDQLLTLAKKPSSGANPTKSERAKTVSLFMWVQRRWQSPAQPVYLLSLFALGFILSALLITDFGDMRQRIAKEISLNHNKQLTLEFHADNFNALREQMSKLDFILRPSSRFENSQYQLLGGRYCSIQGQLAAQLKFQDDQGSIHTLYQTLQTGALTKLAEASLQVDGLNISLWYESGLLYGMASPIL